MSDEDDAARSIAARDRADVLRLNEQLKGIAGVGFNLGTAAIGAAAARIVLAGTVDWIAVTWFLGALVLIWIAAKVLTLLESEM